MRRRVLWMKEKEKKKEYSRPFVITQCFTNGTVMLQYGATEISCDICHIMPYKLYNKVNYFNSINMFDGVNI